MPPVDSWNAETNRIAAREDSRPDIHGTARGSECPSLIAQEAGVFEPATGSPRECRQLAEPPLIG